MAALARGVLLTLTVLLALGLPQGAWAQEDINAAEASGESVPGQVSLKIAQFGTGNVCRGGGWIGVLVEFTDDVSDKPRDLVFRLVMPDPDGDTAFYERAITANPGVRQSVWLYAWMPFDRLGDPITVSVHEAVERTVTSAAAGSGGAGETARLTAGRQLGKIEAVSTRNRYGPTVGLLGVVGRSEAGLGQYAKFLSLANSSNTFAPTGHELTDVVSALSPSPGGLPDRWQGLAQFEAIVWTGSSLEYQPSRLSQSQADALHEWVRRGGHLVIVLPSVGQTWLTGVNDVGAIGNNPLASLMPSVAPIRHENVDLNDYASLLTRPFLRSSSVPLLPKGAVVHGLRPISPAAPYDAMPILVGPASPDDEAEPVVVRKLVGHGAVSVVGIDIAQTSLASSAGLRADVFWHRVLGRRYLLEVPKTQAAAGNAGVTSFNRVTTNLDDMVRPTIEKSGQAAAGLLLAVVVFALYWFVAGLGSYIFLSKKNRKQHAWVAFVGSAAVFTAVAWGGAGMIKVRRVEGRHLTVLDHVYGQEGQRAREWATIFLPTYGDRTIGVTPPQAGGAVSPSTDVIAAFDPGRDALGGLGGDSWKGFPDARGYVVDCRRPSGITVPSRSTVKQITADWLGAIPSTWGMIHPVPDGAQAGAAAAVDGSVPLGSEISLQRRTVPPSSLLRDFQIRGDLVHDLPGTLQEVTVILVRRQEDPRKYPGFMPAVTYAGKHASWKPGEPLDLDTVIPAENKPINTLDQTLKDLVDEQKPRGYGLDTANAGSAGSVADEMVGLSFFNVLTPPDSSDGAAAAVRTLGYGLDLSRWITQPCIIVIGVMNETPSPVPLSVDGDDVRTRIDAGRTIVRWVYPLPPDPPAYRAIETSTEPELAPEPAVDANPQ